MAELVRFPGPWSFLLPKSALILVSDADLEALADPDRIIDLSLTYEKHEASLRQVCERARDAGHRTLILAFDHFFAQYRPGQQGPRRLMPDSEDYIRRVAAVSAFAQGYGLGLELSLLSPLEIGPAYVRATGESGVWMHYRKGVRDPRTGAYSVELWRQTRWTNNKGPIPVEDAGVRVFAFREQSVPGTRFRVVRPDDIAEITETARVEDLGGSEAEPPARRVRVHGQGGNAPGRDRVLVVQQLRTPEMDYFSERALPYLKQLVDRCADAGVNLNALYSDEMHIQQDWHYFSHHDNGQFALRYVSPGFARRFAQLHGPQYADFARWMVYFAYGQEDAARDLSAGEGVMHVFGPSPEEIRQTALFRSHYYRLLQDGVVDLFAAAKRHAQERFGRQLEARAHATWAESPTIDYWRTTGESRFRHSYEYTSNFVWSCTVHQAASACHDYFKWGDFLTGNGNDHAEGGWADRNYWGLALACSTGILNEVPYSYAAHWGMPAALSARRAALESAYGAGGSPLHGLVQDMQHRDVDVLMLYPLDLVAVEERFGSWMTQYGYANQITQDKLLERGSVERGAVVVGGRRFTTLAAAFEPFPSRRLLSLMRRLVESGGRIIWSGPPPVLSRDGEPILAEWERLFGVDSAPGREEGRMAPGQSVVFQGALAGTPPQVILTDFLVDRVHALQPREGVEVVARVKAEVVGTLRRVAGGGQALALGFRPRDDQSASLGQEARTWFEILDHLGAYGPPGGRSTEQVSRTTEVLACRFPNGTLSLAPHFRAMEEGWPGGFARDAARDAEWLKGRQLPTDRLELRGFRVGGVTVTYSGRGAVSFRREEGRLAAFAGSACRRIVLNGRQTVFADRDLEEIAWAPVPAERQVAAGARLQAFVRGEGEVRIPCALRGSARLFAEGAKPGSRGAEVPCRIRGGILAFRVTPAESGRWLYLVDG